MFDIESWINGLFSFLVGFDILRRFSDTLRFCSLLGVFEPLLGGVNGFGML
jgi:hypothetical protein